MTCPTLQTSRAREIAPLSSYGTRDFPPSDGLEICANSGLPTIRDLFVLNSDHPARTQTRGGGAEAPPRSVRLRLNDVDRRYFFPSSGAGRCCCCFG